MELRRDFFSLDPSAWPWRTPSPAVGPLPRTARGVDPLRMRTACLPSASRYCSGFDTYLILAFTLFSWIPRSWATGFQNTIFERGFDLVFFDVSGQFNASRESPKGAFRCDSNRPR